MLLFFFISGQFRLPFHYIMTQTFARMHTIYNNRRRTFSIAILIYGNIFHRFDSIFTSNSTKPWHGNQSNAQRQGAARGRFAPPRTRATQKYNRNDTKGGKVLVLDVNDERNRNFIDSEYLLTYSGQDEGTRPRSKWKR